MDVSVAVVTSALGSAGLFGLIQFLVTRHDSKERDLAQIRDQLDRIENKSNRNELAITRFQLLFLIQTRPDNTDTILKTAQRYFVELQGNGEAWAVFDEWARNRKLDIGWYKALLEREKGKK